MLGDLKENLSLLVSARPASFCPPAKRLVIKAVLVPDQSAVCKLDLQDVEDKYMITQLIVVLLKVHVSHMELRPAECVVANREPASVVS